jgi:Holliday junction DNA helicase RuvA
MFDFFEGKFVEITPSYIVVNCNGIGYKIEISLNSYTVFKDKSEGRVLAHLIVREDAHLLFGFESEKERQLFKYLISVNGVGANTARMILSSLNCDELIEAVVNENVSAIKSVKGIGIKTAQRIIIDLKDNLSKFEIVKSESVFSNKNREEALLALQTLGFNKPVIEKTLDKILKTDASLGVEELIRQALKVL